MRKIFHHSVLVVFGFVVGLMQCLSVAAQSSIQGIEPALIISEVQTTGLDAGGVDVGTQEFIELYNPSDSPLNETAIAAWRLEYLSASHDGSGTPTRVLATIQLAVGSKSYLLFSFQDYLSDADGYFGAGSSSGWLAKSGGHLRIVNASGRTVDAVAWGSAVPLKEGPASGSWWQAPSIPASTSIQRILKGDPAYSDGLAFAPAAEPDPHGGNRPLPPLPDDPDDPQPPSEPGDDPASPSGPGADDPANLPGSCQGIILSELLPNPAGADSGHEFIEIYNAGDANVELVGCSLRLGTAGATFVLPDELLAPGTYRAFYDSETGITLPNATAQTAWLLGASTPIDVRYLDGLKDDQAWAFVAGQWQVTDRPTPGAANISSTPAVAVIAATAMPKPKASSAAAACPPGKERNPATNRCRAGATPAAGLTPCKPGQQRSPETNRCRAVLGAATGPKPCPANQERNPQTNRCRKKAALGMANLAKVTDIDGASSAGDVRWWIAGLVAAGALSYGLYEWRRDVINAFYKFKARYSSKNNPEP